MINKKPKFELGQKVYIPYITKIEKRTVTGVLMISKREYRYFLEEDCNYQYYEKFLFTTKEDCKEHMLSELDISKKERKNKILKL